MLKERKKENNEKEGRCKKERKKDTSEGCGWEDGTPPPHRDFKERGVLLAC